MQFFSERPNTLLGVQSERAKWKKWQPLSGPRPHSAASETVGREMEVESREIEKPATITLHDFSIRKRRSQISGAVT